VQLFTGLEANGLAGGNGDFRAGAGIASHAGLAGLYGEDAEAAQFNAVSLAKSLFHGLEDGIDSGFRLDAWKSGALNYSLDEVLLDQWVAFLMS
jgi:hypothetical protein